MSDLINTESLAVAETRPKPPVLSRIEKYTQAHLEWTTARQKALDEYQTKKGQM